MTKYILSHRQGTEFSNEYGGYPVSLDKQVLIPLANIGTIQQDGQDIVVITTSGHEILLGHTKSEKSAKEGLERLLKALQEDKKEILRLSFSEVAGYLCEIPFE